MLFFSPTVFLLVYDFFGKKFIVNVRNRICFDNVSFCLFSYSFRSSPRYVYLSGRGCTYIPLVAPLSLPFSFLVAFIWIKIDAKFVIYCEYLKPL